jgi:hypothetical protein
MGSLGIDVGSTALFWKQRWFGSGRRLVDCGIMAYGDAGARAADVRVPP